MNTERLRAEHSAQRFYNRRQNEPVEALAGDGAGNVDVASRLHWVWVRIAGDNTKVTAAYNKSAYTFAEDDSILLQWVKRTGLGYYEITGYSGAVVYDLDSSGTGDTTGTGVAAHAWQHIRRDHSTGGFDPLDVSARMILSLRARPQATPGLTLHVEAGPNPLTGNWYAGGNSAAFTAPATPATSRLDLLYLGTDDALHILTGTPVVGGSPSGPAFPNPSVPLAYVYLSYGQTTITESDIYLDPRFIVGGLGFGNVTGPGSSTDNVIARFDGTGGKTLQNSLATVDDSGTVNIPTGQTYNINGSAHTHAGSSLTVKEIDGTPSVASVTEIQVTNGKLTDNTGGSVTIDLTGAAGAPTTAPYVTTAADAGLSAEVVIPGLASSPNIAGAAGAGTSEEYDTATTGLTWSSAPPTVDSNTTVKSHLYVATTDATEFLGTKDWSAAGALDARAHMLLGGSGGIQFALMIANSDLSNRVLLQLEPANARYEAYSYVPSSYTTRGGVTHSAIGAGEGYIRITRDGSDNWSFYASGNGIVWILVATLASFAFTVAKIGYRVQGSASGCQCACDWIRTDV